MNIEVDHKFPFRCKFLFTAFALLFSIACTEHIDVPDCTEVQCGHPAYSPRVHFVDQINAKVLEINALTLAPVKLSVPADILSEVATATDPLIVSFTTVDPDIIVSESAGAWNLATTTGYTAAIIRHLVVDDVTRKIELKNELATQLPEYFDSVAPMTRVASLGHMRKLTDGSYNNELALVAETINAHQPNYVYLLGDMVWTADAVKLPRLKTNLIEELVEPSIESIIYVPGNHEWFQGPANSADFMAFINDPLNSVLGPETVITTDHVNLIGLRSTADWSEAQPYLVNTFSTIDSQKPTWVFTHHEVWNSHPTGWTHAQFTAAEFMSEADGIVDVVFAGDMDINILDIEKVTPAPSSTMDAYWVGSGQGYTENDGSSGLYFAIASMGVDEVFRIKSVYVDLNEGHRYYDGN